MVYTKLSDRCRIILQVEKSFRDDFSFRDVARELERTHVFTAEECRNVLLETTEEDQTEKMLFLLMYKNKKELTTFQAVLQKDYDWLSDAISHALDNDTEKFLAYEKCIRESNTPNNRSGVIYRTDLLWQMRKELEKLDECNYLVIHGNTGSGKRWLAIDACSDPCIIRAMNYKIFWLNVSDCTKPEKILNQMERLKVMLQASVSDKELIDIENRYNSSPYLSIEARIEAERNDLRAILKSDTLRDALVVLCDLNNEMTQNAFDLHCKILVTTRNLCTMARVNEGKKKMISTNGGFTEAECCCLFENSLAQQKGIHLRGGYVNEIHRTINGNPNLASKIAKNLQSIYDGNVEKRLKEWIMCLAQGVENNNRTKMVMDESLKVLDNEEAEMYKKLAIFQPNCLIPIPVLARYFGVTVIEVEEFVRKLEKFALLEIDHVQISSRVEDQQMMCRLQFINAQYLCRLGRDDLVQYHRNLVNSYKIVNGLLENRRDCNVLPFPADHYFYTFIGYHLCEGEMYSEFAQLFSDFGFLEVKIRESGLNNTLGDLKMYQEKFTEEVLPFFLHLPYFLQNVEGRIYQIMDLTLLQQALGGSYHVRKQAWEQTIKYPGRVWFRMNCGEKWRKIVQLCSSPNILRFLTSSSVLVAQKNHQIVQTDLTYNSKYIPNVFSGHQTEIVQMEVFSKSYLVSLDRSSVMYCWYVGKKNDRKMMMTTGQKRRQFAGHTYYNIHDAYKLNPLQKIDNGQKSAIVCFHTLYDGKNHKLLCATASGQILTYNWMGDQFVHAPTENFTTKLLNIKCLQYIGNMKLLVLDTSGKIHGFSLRNHEPIGFTKPPWMDVERPISVHFNLRSKLIFCVFANKIRQIKIKWDKLNFVQISFIQEIYRTNGDTTIECSALARNGKFLVLGTKTGITVFDCSRRMEIGQNCIGEHIACIDVFTSHEIIVIFGNHLHKNIANLFEIKVQNQPATTLNHHLFTVIESSNSNPTLYVVDAARKLREYSVQSKVDIIEVVEKHPLTVFSTHTITAIANNQQNKTIYLGCEDGSVFQYNNSTCTFLTQALAPVEYLEYVNGVIVIGTNLTFKIHGEESHNGQLLKCYAVNTQHLLMIKKSLNIEILEMRSNKIITTFDCNEDLNLKFCDFASPYLVTCARHQQSLVIHKVKDGGVIVKIKNLSRKNDNLPTAIAVSADGNIFAIGFNNGNVNIYDISNEYFKLLHVLESHKSAVTQLLFSPWSDDKWPQILISLAEQICFWNVKFLLNNRAGLLPFNGKKSDELGQLSLSERTKRLTIDNHHHQQSQQKKGGWDGKMGASTKPELLSCVKFVGNKARKVFCDNTFEKFITIDDEGEIYVLQLHDYSTSSEETPSLR